MDNRELVEYLDQHRWLMNNGLLNDGIKNQLFMFGTVVNKEVKAVELDINAEKKHLTYSLFFDEKMLKTIEKYRELSKAKNLLGMWRFKRLLKKHGNLNLIGVLNSFVKDFCGPEWSVELKLLNEKGYEEGFNKGADQGPPADQQPH